MNAKHGQLNNTITSVSRRQIIDYLCVGRHWSGAIPEDDFLGRLYDLDRMPSTDSRPEFDTAAKDIWKHRVINFDWSDDWVFTDHRFGLLHGSDEAFLRFLVETVHPIVRPDSQEAQAMVSEYNSAINIDGWEIYAATKISNKPVFGYRQILATQHLDEAKSIAERISGTHIAQQVRRLQESAESDPELAIGTSKEFLESICKTILTERGLIPSRTEDLPGLVKSTVKSLSIVPQDLVNVGHAERTITVLLNSLGSIGHQLAELRNQFGTGHGRVTSHVGLRARHAKLAIGSAAALAVFLYESHEAEDRSE